MARNRKNGSTAFRFGPVLVTLVLCLLIGGAGVGYVWQKEQIDGLSRRIDERAAKLAKLSDENENWKRLLANARSLGSVEARIKELNLGLAQPSPTQIWHLAEPPRETPKPAPRQPQDAAQNPRLWAAAGPKNR
jgi:uncharacterized protein HemX